MCGLWRFIRLGSAPRGLLLASRFRPRRSMLVVRCSRRCVSRSYRCVFRPCAVVVGSVRRRCSCAEYRRKVPIKPARGLVAICSAGMSSVTESFRVAPPVSSVFVVVCVPQRCRNCLLSVRRARISASLSVACWPSVASFATKLVVRCCPRLTPVVSVARLSPSVRIASTRPSALSESSVRPPSSFDW